MAEFAESPPPFYKEGDFSEGLGGGGKEGIIFGGEREMGKRGGG